MNLGIVGRESELAGARAFFDGLPVGGPGVRRE
jgi:hypothetical protein